jgi:hypothetical protein
VRIDDTKNAEVSVIPPGSPISPSGSTVTPYTIQQLKDGITLSGEFVSGTVVRVVAYSTTRDGVSVQRDLRIEMASSP